MIVGDLSEGMRVTYVPNHADGAGHSDCERGVVTAWRTSVERDGVNETTVFVRYGADQNSKATSLHNLVPG